MEIHEQELQISQCDEPELEPCADGLPSICRIELPKQVMEMSLDRRDSQAELLRQALGW